MLNGSCLVVSIFVASKQFGSFQVEVYWDDLHDCILPSSVQNTVFQFDSMLLRLSPIKCRSAVTFLNFKNLKYT